MPNHKYGAPLSLDPRIAHELRSLVNAVSLAADLFERGELQSVQREAAAVVRRNTRALSDLIDRLSGTARESGPSSGTVPNERPPPGARVLVVEDEYFLAQIVSDFLKQADCEVIGPAGTIEDALNLVSENALDCAVVDVNLDGQFSSPIIDALRARHVPAAILSGYDQAAIPDIFRDLPFLHKPVNPPELLKLVAGLSGQPAAETRKE